MTVQLHTDQPGRHRIQALRACRGTNLIHAVKHRQCWHKKSWLVWLGAVFLAVAASSCVAQPSWTCRQSSECPADDFCRVGQCVPAVGFTTDAGLADDKLADDTLAGDRHAGDRHAGDATDAGPAAAGCPDGAPPDPGELVLNEVLANVPGGDDGDANADGIRDAYDDEFVELVNQSERTLDVSGVRIQNGSTEKFAFGPTCLEPHQAAVVFGGGQPAQQPNVVVRVADSRFGLSNSGGRVVVAGADGHTLATLDYGDGPAEALTLAPQLDGTDYVAHSTLAAGRLLSPGRCPAGQSFEQGCAPPPDD